MVSGQSSGPANGIAVSLNTSDFPAQSVRVVNTTPFLMSVTCNTSNFDLKPFAYKVTRITEDALGIGVRMSIGGELNEVANGVYP